MICYTLEAKFKDEVLKESKLYACTPPVKSFEYKNGWSPFSTTFLCENAESYPELMRMLYSFYNFGATVFSDWESLQKMEENISPLLATGTLRKHIDSEITTDIWNFKHLWPHSVNFGDLCYSSDPTIHLEITWRAKEVEHIINSGLCNSD